MRSLLRRTEPFALRAIALLLLVAAIATPIPAMSQGASPDKPGLANVIDIPANVAIVLLRIVTQKDAYALRLADEANNTVENLPLTDRGSAKVCVRAQTTARKFKVVGVSLPDERLLAAIVRWEPDSHVYDVAVWDQSTPHTVRVVATAKLALSGATSDSCGSPG
jgi:hypothetical protein